MTRSFESLMNVCVSEKEMNIRVLFKISVVCVVSKKRRNFNFYSKFLFFFIRMIIFKSTKYLMLNFMSRSSNMNQTIV